MPCPNVYDLLRPVRVLRQDLGLTPNDLAVLAALVSFLPRAEPDQPRLWIVFPSNAALAERANGLDERTLRRCLVRLTAAGLLKRRNSANGKRFPLRRGGVIRDAFGFNLAPLQEQHPLLQARAAEAAQLRETLRSLRAEALALRAARLQRPDLTAAEAEEMAALRNLLRRTTISAQSVRDIITVLRQREELHRDSDLPACRDNQSEPMGLTADLTGSDGQNDRQTESNKIEVKDRQRARDREAAQGEPSMGRDPQTLEWKDFHHVAGLFPEAPVNATMLSRVLLDLGSLLRIGQDRIMAGLRKAGAGRVLLACDYLIAKAQSIRHPGAYFDRLMVPRAGPIVS